MTSEKEEKKRSQRARRKERKNNNNNDIQAESFLTMTRIKINLIWSRVFLRVRATIQRQSIKKLFMLRPQCSVGWTSEFFSSFIYFFLRLFRWIIYYITYYYYYFYYYDFYFVLLCIFVVTKDICVYSFFVRSFGILCDIRAIPFCEFSPSFSLQS